MKNGNELSRFHQGLCKSSTKVIINFRKVFLALLEFMFRLPSLSSTPLTQGAYFCLSLMKKQNYWKARDVARVSDAI